MCWVCVRAWGRGWGSMTLSAAASLACVWVSAAPAAALLCTLLAPSCFDTMCQPGHV
jgi:hypothetical protein